MKLYEIADAQRRFFDAVIENEGVLTPELEAQGNTITSDLKTKARDCIGYWREMNCVCDSIASEIEKLEASRGAIKSKIDRFKDYMLRCLGPEAKIETSLGKLSFHPSTATEVYDESIVPPEYWVTPEPTPPTPRIDKARILKEGREVNGVRIVKNYSLQIK